MSPSAPVFEPSRPLPIPNGAGETSAAAAAAAAAVAASRVTKPLPNSRRAAPLPTFVPQQAQVPKSNEAKENTRRLIVVLSQVRNLPLA